MINNIGLMDLLVKKMSYLNEAQEAHAQNVANANTPGYKPLEVQPFSFSDALKQANIAVATTDPRHITPVSMMGSSGVVKRATGDKRDDAQDVEQESTQVGQTGLQYQVITSIFHKMAGLFKIALKGSST